MESNVGALRRLAHVDDPRSLANRFRGQRFARFDQLAARLRRPLRLLDVGGTPQFWAQRGWSGRDDVDITVLNAMPFDIAGPNICVEVGDAADLSRWSDDAFDVVFSNSVIEHLFTLRRQAAMAAEVDRVGQAFWVQTPSQHFPVEPHFLVPGWQWLPEDLRVAWLRRRRVGWRGPFRNPDEARRMVREVRLLTRRELSGLFPGATLLPERVAGVVKSWVAYGGFPLQAA
ncbi:MAG: methyltransferase domain-containing protein [Acidimicrobiia bacterium]|nr:methyltransferase domain-containing protein [Acidimicrobiia bacterium]